MRKRAELKAAVSKLERPWDIVETPPNLFSLDADEQLKVLADRFQKPDGFDMWSEKDGPELFRPDNGLPSSRFFPKGVVHSVKPYAMLGAAPEEFEVVDPKDDLGPDPIMERGLVRKKGESRNLRMGLGPEAEEDTGLVRKNGKPKNWRRGRSSSDKEGEGGNYNKGKLRQEGNKGRVLSGSQRLDSVSYTRSSGSTNPRRGSTNGELLRSKDSNEKSKNVNTEVFDMSMRDDGIYGLE